MKAAILFLCLLLCCISGTANASDFSGLAAGFIAPPILAIVFLYLLIVSKLENISPATLRIAKIIFAITSLFCVALIHDAFSSVGVSAIFFISYGAVIAAFVAVVYSHEKQQKSKIEKTPSADTESA